MHRIAEKYPDVRIEITHYGTPILRAPSRNSRHEARFGANADIDYEALTGPIEMIKPHPNLFCGLADYQRLICSGEEYPYWTALRIVEVLTDGLGADRVIFGTDWPHLGEVGYPELIRAIREAPFLTDAEADIMILGGNAWRLLWGDGTGPTEPAARDPRATGG